VVVAVVVYLFVVVNMPNLLSHSDNYMLADPGVTPNHIVPEWYFLPFYGILRSVPDKAGGVFLLVAALVTLFILPLVSKPPVQSGMFRPVFRYGFEVFLVVWLILGWSGGNPIESPFYEICQLATLLYFMFFFVFIPLVVLVEEFIGVFYYEGVSVVGRRGLGKNFIPSVRRAFMNQKSNMCSSKVHFNVGNDRVVYPRHVWHFRYYYMISHSHMFCCSHLLSFYLGRKHIF